MEYTLLMVAEEEARQEYKLLLLAVAWLLVFKL